MSYTVPECPKNKPPFAPLAVPGVYDTVPAHDVGTGKTLVIGPRLYDRMALWSVTRLTLEEGKAAMLYTSSQSTSQSNDVKQGELVKVNTI